MEGQNVSISESAHQLLSQLAEMEKISKEAVLDRALENYRRQVFLKQANAAFEALRADSGAWQEELEERELWNNTLADGAEEQ
ncbi:MAG TPA: toxin-antitoxin system protein [Blastocatellia bacterium]|nr:toxin-antitoxin system protein [Blastocatellia bacterium]